LKENNTTDALPLYKSADFTPLFEEHGYIRQLNIPRNNIKCSDLTIQCTP
jgi:hypothetical protein